MNNLNTLVIDNGTGYTKMGYAGNSDPTHYFPTVIADHMDKATVQISKTQNDQLDFYIGDEALKYSRTHKTDWPISSGLINDWEKMEKFWHRSIFDMMRCEPEETSFILTEPPMNPPENREKMAEIFFETFNAKGLYIGVQAVLALYSSSYNEAQNTGKPFDLTGTVMDSGDGVTHVIPVSDGYVIGSCIKHIPLAGRDMTKFIRQLIMDRGENIPIEDSMQVAKEIKEKYSYVCENGLLAEFELFDQRKKPDQPSKRFKSFEATKSANGEKYNIDVGYEQFLGPEMFFHPEFVDNKWRKPIDQVIDETIQACPIDTRKKLYGNIVLSGGSSSVKGFETRLQSEIQKRVDFRLSNYRNKVSNTQNTQKFEIKCNVIENPFKKFSVWQGGSYIATNPNWSKMQHSKEQYDEYGPSICRHNAMFTA